MSTCTWSFLKEEWNVLTGWNDGDSDNAVSEIDPAGQLHLQQTGMSALGRSSRTKDVGTFGNGNYTVLFKFVADNWDADVISGYNGLGGFKMTVEAGTNQIQFAILQDGFAVYDGGAWNTTAFTFTAGTWYTIRLDVHNSQTDVDVYVDNVIKATDADCSETTQDADGTIDIKMYGSDSNDSEGHIDYLYINNGLCNPLEVGGFIINMV